MKVFNCIIADDEKLARDVVQNYVARIEYLNLIAICRDGMEVNAILHKQNADILFLDIKMPHISGLSLIKALSRTPKVIFTTAFKDHAIEAFELNVIDYLLKPFSFERFLQAVNKATQEQASIAATQEKFIQVKVERHMVRVPINDIIYMEAAGNYIKIHLEDGKTLVPHASIRELVDLLPKKKFQQIHRSYVVNFDKVLKYATSSIDVKGAALPVGRNYKSAMKIYLKQVRKC